MKIGDTPEGKPITLGQGSVGYRYLVCGEDCCIQVGLTGRLLSIETHGEEDSYGWEYQFDFGWVSGGDLKFYSAEERPTP